MDYWEIPVVLNYDNVDCILKSIESFRFEAERNAPVKNQKFLDEVEERVEEIRAKLLAAVKQEMNKRGIEGDLNRYGHITTDMNSVWKPKGT